MENKKNRSWVIPAVVAALIAITGASFTLARSDARLDERTKGIEINRVDIQRVEDQKADKAVVDRVDAALIRIEEKLDQHIIDSKH